MQIHDEGNAQRPLFPHILLDPNESLRLRAGDNHLQEELEKSVRDYLQTHREFFVLHLYNASNRYHGFLSLATLEQYQQRDTPAERPREEETPSTRPLVWIMSGHCSSGNCQDCAAYMFDATSAYRCSHDCHEWNDDAISLALA